MARTVTRTVTRAGATTLSAPEFAALMDRAGPFEPAPRIAVGVSGGADSVALALLTDRWTRARGGAVVALTVDHRLRRGSGAEARQVGRTLGRHGLPHHVLTWQGAAPAANIQAAAREARFRLLGQWCRRHGILHLLLAHHLEDQAETLLLRLGRGSGTDGLAGMPMVTETRDFRIVRPLIGVRRARLRAVLRARRVDWIEDPSNRDDSFARVRVRRALPVLAAEGLDVERLAATARNMGRARAALEQETARLLARAATAYPTGYCTLDAALFATAPREVSLRALSRVLMCVGGNIYPPRLERLERLHDRVTGGGLAGGRTLAGCHIAPRGGMLSVIRERRAAAECLGIGPGMDVLWDGRFRIVLAGKRHTGAAPFTLAALGAEGWRQLVDGKADIGDCHIPPAVRLTLPALRDRRGIVAVPHLGYTRGYARRERKHARPAIRLAQFAPSQPLMGAVFAVV